MTSPPSMNAPVSQRMLSDMTVPPPSFSGVSLDTASEANQALSPKMSMPQEQAVPKLLPQLSRLCTSNLGFSAGLQLPITPSRLLNSALSPSQSIAAAVTQDWNAWLDEPIVPSPMYEHGPCTGWNGLLSGMDSRTPTAVTTRISSAKEVQNSTQGDTDNSSQTINASPPALISAIDWWKQDTEAQLHFHKYTMACFPGQQTFHEGGPKSTLSASVLSRFLAYCSFLCLREPTAPHPPFMHRHLLMMMKDRLPESLAIASSVMAALAMRLPTSEAWAWRLLSAETKAVVNVARSIIANNHGSSHTHRRTASLGHSLDGLDDVWEMVGVIQALWCYTVIAIAEKIRNPAEAASEASMHRPWSSHLISETIDVLQCMLGILAQTGFDLQNHAWESWTKKSEESANVKPFDFLCWCLCETIRRTVLATHALLILLRHLRIGCDNNGSDAVLGHPPYPSHTYPLEWGPVMTIKLPVVADIFEESNEAVWRVHLENATSCLSNETLALNLFIKHRPKTNQGNDAGINSMVYSYFNQHDEFTNVCLSTLFGLTAAV
ncbi:hypothetical protein MNAN1_001831 [Malassezia nana]|uniref:Transcription factor domain-containing protein n=1 Tax=Malassezia nana TaxID=180528 RepID=A0AAF0J2B0_9BASI|nr:hypothetical protein MNAN1_001831 [Malassezia nana]